MYFDSHAHLDDVRIINEFPGGTDAAVAASAEESVFGIINVGTNPENSLSSIKLAEKYSNIYAAVGLHPSDSQKLTITINEAVDRIIDLLDHNKAVALGEIGLDYHYDDTNREKQKYAFDLQLSIAEEKKIPVIIHDRDSHGDVFDIIKSHKNVNGVFHSFSGSAETARQLVAIGWYVSFSGTVTYKNAHKVKEAAAAVPDDRILIETDSPYLPPVPHRGELNYSGYIKYTAAAIAEIRNVSIPSFAEQTVANTVRLFNIDYPNNHNIISEKELL